MFWWRRQTVLKKVFYAGALMSLAAGISAGSKGITGGTLLFIVFLFIALLLPSKPKAKTEQEKAWNYVITPHVPKKNKLMQFIFSVIAIIIALIAVYFLLDFLLKENYAVALICCFVMVASLSSFVYLHPAIYNEFFSRTKIIPLDKKTNTKALFEEVSTIKTTYGTPLMGLVEGIKEPVAVYRIIDYNWIVFFYIKNDEIIIDSRYQSPDEMDMNETDWVLIFIQQLANMFSFIENTGNIPDDKEIAKLFTLPENRKQI